MFLIFQKKYLVIFFVKQKFEKNHNPASNEIGYWCFLVHCLLFVCASSSSFRNFSCFFCIHTVYAWRNEICFNIQFFVFIPYTLALAHALWNCCNIFSCFGRCYSTLLIYQWFTEQRAHAFLHPVIDCITRCIWRTHFHQCHQPMLSKNGYIHTLYLRCNEEIKRFWMLF